MNSPHELFKEAVAYSGPTGQQYLCRYTGADEVPVGINTGQIMQK